MGAEIFCGWKGLQRMVNRSCDISKLTRQIWSLMYTYLNLVRRWPEINIFWAIFLYYIQILFLEYLLYSRNVYNENWPISYEWFESGEKKNVNVTCQSARDIVDQLLGAVSTSDLFTPCIRVLLLDW